ncbi:MAG: prepilin-type N-terminal cleavage/methylation domain-containing protein [Magnetococcales bacterium]|nr:prepilin-type N-terminal cleavage/methylation domain-containing protein [Magnetococcales bacterium]
MLTLSGQHNQGGHTLLELLVALAISITLLTWMTDAVTRTLADYSTTLQRNLLNQEVQSVLAMLDRELRRAGAWGNATASAKSGPTNPFTVPPYRLNIGNKTGESSNSCITYSYDLNGNGLLDQSAPDERFGFRLNQGAVEMRTGGSGTLDCNAGSWTGLTGAALVMDSLLFTLVDHCINLSRSGANCSTTTPTKGDLLVRDYRVEVTMRGYLQQKPAIQRSDTLLIRVRNSSVESAP